MVETLGETVQFYKIGMQLFTKCGPQIVERVKSAGGTKTKIFLDLKFHDIPNTVRGAVESACALGVDMLTIHLSGGSQMIRAAAAGAEGISALVLGVSVLTSSTRETLREVAIEGDRTYFDTNTSNHFHYYIETEDRLFDIEARELSVNGLPEPPPGTKVARIDVIVRLRRDS